MNEAGKGFGSSQARPFCVPVYSKMVHAKGVLNEHGQKPESATPFSGSPLPYRDTKPIGAADFYFVINATFRFIAEKFGLEQLRAYWTDLGRDYFAPVTRAWGAGGLPAVANYWRAFFNAEPEAQVQVNETAERVKLEIQVCPAIHRLRKHGREMVPRFCEHCYFVSEAMAQGAGLTVRIEGGNGQCRQLFMKRNAAPEEQDLGAILEAKC